MALLDEGSGNIYGAPVAIFAQDFTVAGGSLGLMHSRKITKIMDHALKMKNKLKCKIRGKIKRIPVKKGDKVAKGTILLELE
jgi:acetyl/propionyl-CoA carboxylase alpha subunit